MNENRQIRDNVEIHVGAQVNCSDKVDYVEINEKTNLIFNCCTCSFCCGNAAAAGGSLALKSFLIGLLVISAAAAVGKKHK